MTGSVGKVVQPALASAAARDTGAGGKRLPADGNRPSPAAAAAAAVAQAAADLRTMAERWNAQMIENRRALRFQVDESSGDMVITVLNPETGEIVRQIPSPEVLAMARWLDGNDLGALLQERA